jgi:hypothetical protein
MRYMPAHPSQRQATTGKVPSVFRSDATTLVAGQPSRWSIASGGWYHSAWVCFGSPRVGRRNVPLSRGLRRDFDAATLAGSVRVATLLVAAVNGAQPQCSPNQAGRPSCQRGQRLRSAVWEARRISRRHASACCRPSDRRWPLPASGVNGALRRRRRCWAWCRSA